MPFRLNTTKTDGCTKLVLLELFAEIRPTTESKPEPMQRNSLIINNITRPATVEADTWQAVLGKEQVQVSICDCETASTMFVPMGIQGHGMDIGCFHIEQVLKCLPAFEGTVNRREYMTTPILTLLEELFLFHWFFVVVAVVFVCLLFLFSVCICFRFVFFMFVYFTLVIFYFFFCLVGFFVLFCLILCFLCF